MWFIAGECIAPWVSARYLLLLDAPYAWASCGNPAWYHATHLCERWWHTFWLVHLSSLWEMVLYWRYILVNKSFVINFSSETFQGSKGCMFPCRMPEMLNSQYQTSPQTDQPFAFGWSTQLVTSWTSGLTTDIGSHYPHSIMGIYTSRLSAAVTLAFSHICSISRTRHSYACFLACSCHL